MGVSFFEGGKHSRFMALYNSTVMDLDFDSRVFERCMQGFGLFFWNKKCFFPCGHGMAWHGYGMVDMGFSGVHEAYWA